MESTEVYFKWNSKSRSERAYIQKLKRILKHLGDFVVNGLVNISCITAADLHKPLLIVCIEVWFIVSNKNRLNFKS